MWDLPGPGLEPVSPALAGGFLTTAPPGKPLDKFLNFYFIVVRTVNMRSTLNTFSSVQSYISVDCRYSVVQQISRAHSSCFTETLWPLISSSPFPPAPAPGNTIPLFDSLNLPILSTSYKWKHAVFVLL